MPDGGVMWALWGWLALFGIWPLAHPDHSALTAATVIDLALHAVGLSAFLPLVLRRRRTDARWFDTYDGGEWRRRDR